MIELSNCLWMPVTDFYAEELVSLEKQLTAKVIDLGTGETIEVMCLREDREGYIGLPRVFGLKLISGQKYVDLRSKGTRVRFPRTVSLRDEQVQTVDEIMDACETLTDFMVRAATGKGKTVMALAVAQRRAVTTVVIVDQENLLEQWIERAVQHLGMKIEDIGIVRGPKKDWVGKKLVICMVQTLVSASNNLPEEFYKYFGTAIFDEGHVMGARTYSQALMLFCAEVRFALSASERKDGFKKLLAWNLGKIDVVLDAELEQSTVYIVESHGTYSWSANNSKLASRYINEVADDGARNLLLAKLTKWLYDSGRDSIVVSDRVEHLCSLMALCRALGVPQEDMGLYSKTQTVWEYQKDPRPPRKPVGLWDNKSAYTPVKLVLAQKTIPKKHREMAKENARVIFATYGIIAKGVDIPRLSGGVDATPRREATQLLGRILRILPGKIRPVWFTIADRNSFRSLFQLVGRIADYLTSNAEIYLWHPTKGRKLLDARGLQADLREEIALLRHSKIVTGLDGNNTLLIPSTPTVKSNSPARPTGRTRR